MNRRRTIVSRLLLLGALAALLAACSPEADRPRGGGVGASSSNLPAGGLVPKSKVFTNGE